MKPSIFILFVFLSLTSIHSQVFRVNGVDSFLAVENDNSMFDGLSESEIQKVKLKKYLTDGFKPVIVNGEKSTFFIRYNIYEDQMEFVKDEQVYYLGKAPKNRVKFRTMNKTYICLNWNGDPHYFELILEADKIGLVAKQTVKFIEPKKATTSYGVDKPADFKRSKDVYYFTKNGELYKTPSKKKDFINFFENQSDKVKKYMKKEKLSHRDSKDIVKILNFINE